MLKEEFWNHRRVVVTGGGTVEKIDDVRYLSNFSSGKMASALATALYLKGADVDLVATRKDDNLPLSLHSHDVESSETMLERLKDLIALAKKGKMIASTIKPVIFIERITIRNIKVTIFVFIFLT